MIHIFFIPFLARGHILPIVAIPRLFARRGVRCTIVSVPGNSSYINPTIKHAQNSGLLLDLITIPFPAADVGLPTDAQCTDVCPPGPDSFRKLNAAVGLLRDPFEKLCIEHRPDVIVSDFNVLWAVDVALSLSVLHLVFCATCPFSKYVADHLFFTGSAHLASSSATVVVPLAGLPHPIELTRSEIPPFLTSPAGLFEGIRDVERKSCGVIFNSFDELAPEYVEGCRRTILPGCSKNVWCIGPVQLGDTSTEQVVTENWQEIKDWLDSKKPDSVLYICFGSECPLVPEQVKEMALGLEKCKSCFILVLKKEAAETINEAEFYARVGGRGLVLTEWAPQTAILNHWATGGFVTHCGWNSTLEAVCAGVPVIAWPMRAEQFLNERLVVEVLGVGVRILEGAEMRTVEDEGRRVVTGEVIGAAVDRLMGNINYGGGQEEAMRAIRRTANKYGEMARSAMEEGGSSYANLSSLIEHIIVLGKEKERL